MLIANVLPKLKIVNILISTLSKSTGAEHGLTFNIWKCPKYLQNFHEIVFIMKMCPLVLGEILGVFLNTLTSDGKYPLQGCENLQVPI